MPRIKLEMCLCGPALSQGQTPTVVIHLDELSFFEMAAPVARGSDWPQL